MPRGGIPDDVELMPLGRRWREPSKPGFRIGGSPPTKPMGQVKYLRVWLELHDVAHAMATCRNDTFIITECGDDRADILIACLPARAWKRLSVGAGAHWPRDTTGRVCRSVSSGRPAAVTGCWPIV